MITKSQIEELAGVAKIDRFTVFREYLQLLFLSYLYQNKKASQIYFKGGTAIHLLLASPRFSEDLDFSTQYDQKGVKKIIGEVKKEITKELPEAEILLLYQGRKSLRFKLKYQSLDFKYPLAIKMDFSENEKPKITATSPLITKFPVAFFPLVSHLGEEEILAEKIRAFLTRAKGRDLYDLWFLLGKGIKIDFSLLKQKMKQLQKKFDQNIFLEKIKDYPSRNLQSDLAKFLPEPQRRMIPILKENLLKILTNI